jgi:WD40 repeat protein
MQETSRDLDPCLAFVERCLISYSLEQETIISIYNRVLMGEQIPLDEGDPVHNRLILSGAVRQRRGLLCVRNRIIEKVFGKQWTATQLPRSVIQVQRFVYLRGIRRGVLLSLYTTCVFIVAGLAVLSSRRQALLSEMRAIADEDRAYRLAYDYRFVAILERISHYGLNPGLTTLKVTTPEPGKPDLRNFEWYYLDKVVHQGHRATDWLPGGPGGLVWNAAGTQFAVGTGTEVRIWDNAVQDFLPRKYTVANMEIGGQAISPDGKTLALAKKHAAIQLVNIANGATLAVIGQEIKEEEIRTAAWSPDGSLIAEAGSAGAVRVFSMPSGKPLRLLPATGRVPARGIWKIVFSSDSKTLAVACDDGSLRLFDTKTGLQRTELTAHRKYVHSVDISRDGKFAITGSGDGAVHLWDISGETPKIVQRMLGHSSYVYDVCFSPDGKSAASTGWDKSVRIWDLQTGLQKRTIATATDGWALAYSRDGKQLALGMSSGEVRVYDIGTGLLEHSVDGEEFHAQKLRITPDNKTVSATSNNGLIASYDISGLKMRVQTTHSPDFTVSSISASGEIAVRTGIARCEVLNATNASVKYTFNTQFSTPPTDCAISSDGRLVIAVAGRVLKIWRDASLVDSTTLNFTGNLQHTALSPDSRNLAVFDEVGGHACFSINQQGKLKPQKLQPTEDNIMELDYSRDGKFLIGQTGRLILWDVKTGRIARRLTELSQEAMPLDTSVDGSRLVYGVRSGIMRVWDLTTDQNVLDLPDQSPAPARLALSNDGRILAICPHSGLLRIIDTR